MSRITRPALLAIDGLVALSAIGGGLAMVAGVDKFPAEWLEGTPFDSYFLPGLLLALTVGGSAAIATAAQVTARVWGGLASVAAGCILIGWLAVEIGILNQPSAPTPTEIVFFALGLVMSALGLSTARRVPRSLSR
jgi:hypothetical protein